MCSFTSTITRQIIRRGAGTLNSPFCRVRGCALHSSLLPLVALAVLGGCEIDKTAIPRTDSRVALHAVLSALAPTQVVLLERTRSGRVQLVAPPFDLEDPIGSDEGVAEPGALVTLLMPNGSTIVATEDAAVNGKGQGVYSFPLPRSSLPRNAAYHLTVFTTAGERTS